VIIITISDSAMSVSVFRPCVLGAPGYGELHGARAESDPRLGSELDGKIVGC
jgi:hypothetical protein